MNKIEFLKRVGQKIKEIREPIMTQEELAEKLNTQYPQIGRIERGGANCTLDTLLKIANELGVTVSTLVDVQEKSRRK